MNRKSLPLLIVFNAALVVATGVAAAEEAPARSSAPASTEAATDKAKKAEVLCEPSAATRVQRKKVEGCDKLSSPTRSYSREEIERTGQNDVGRALKQLDPRFY